MGYRIPKVAKIAATILLSPLLLLCFMALTAWVWVMNWFDDDVDRPAP